MNLNLIKQLTETSLFQPPTPDENSQRKQDRKRMFVEMDSDELIPLLIGEAHEHYSRASVAPDSEDIADYVVSALQNYTAMTLSQAQFTWDSWYARETAQGEATDHNQDVNESEDLFAPPSEKEVDARQFQWRRIKLSNKKTGVPMPGWQNRHWTILGPIPVVTKGFGNFKVEWGPRTSTKRSPETNYFKTELEALGFISKLKMVCSVLKEAHGIDEGLFEPPNQEELLGRLAGQEKEIEKEYPGAIDLVLAQLPNALKTPNTVDGWWSRNPRVALVKRLRGEYDTGTVFPLTLAASLRIVDFALGKYKAMGGSIQEGLFEPPSKDEFDSRKAKRELEREQLFQSFKIGDKIRIDIIGLTYSVGTVVDKKFPSLQVEFESGRRPVWILIDEAEKVNEGLFEPANPEEVSTRKETKRVEDEVLFNKLNIGDKVQIGSQVETYGGLVGKIIAKNIGICSRHYCFFVGTSAVSNMQVRVKFANNLPTAWFWLDELSKINEGLFEPASSEEISIRRNYQNQQFKKEYQEFQKELETIKQKTGIPDSLVHVIGNNILGMDTSMVSIPVWVVINKLTRDIIKIVPLEKDADELMKKFSFATKEKVWKDVYRDSDVYRHLLAMGFKGLENSSWIQNAIGRREQDTVDNFESVDEGLGKTLAAGAIATVAMFGPMGTPNAVAHQTHAQMNIQFEKGLKPELVQKLRQLEVLAKKQGIDFRVTSGYRSPEEQAKLYAQGRTTPGKVVTHLKHSKHNEGKAFDVVVFNKNGEPDWSPQAYSKIGQLGKSIGLTWGGDWKMRDLAHFQID